MTGRSCIFSNFLALISVLLLIAILPSALGAEGGYCLNAISDKDPGTECVLREEILCSKIWRLDGTVGPNGCISRSDFKTKYGFDWTTECGPVTGKSKEKLSYACGCLAVDKPCNDADFGENKFKAWKEEKEATTKAPGGSSSVLSPLRPLTFFAALLTLGAILGR